MEKNRLQTIAWTREKQTVIDGTHIKMPFGESYSQSCAFVVEFKNFSFVFENHEFLFRSCHSGTEECETFVAAYYVREISRNITEFQISYAFCQFGALFELLHGRMVIKHLHKMHLKNEPNATLFPVTDTYAHKTNICHISKSL